MHDMFERMLKSRENVKELLVVLQNDPNDQSDFVLSDRTSRNSKQKTQQDLSDPNPEVRSVPYKLSAEEIKAKELAASKTWYAPVRVSRSLS